MFKKIRINFVAVVSALSLMLVPIAVPAMATVSADSVSDSLCGGIHDSFSGTSGIGGSDENCTITKTTDADGLNNIAKTALTIFSWVVGVASVLMIIYGGFRYVTSGGESSKVTGAKNTIIYAIIGLVVVALAQAIVAFVLNKATS